mmetsp:Transcript_85171/g.194264  ORF Transcript_85171/g.194264 Transcript_85171/m.194264 type:complete len:776 (+) Transcript_85171:61-2388(+)|eukprot:CAMPEP_0204332672 /NCGR_PEP_ID=MMETSP0469-20131031/16639_1 /ASSEMBLY_ACC=CAM_ASM_000384 /TAXON_ID=2969 /ORGANISM="Oxyrrhis marina" /LENGTH=775 /DNA_ID=CAMNT_0051315863 /DNA_START=19 /DNA_END=2346 /DNA_ORIENTATION=+
MANTENFRATNIRYFQEQNKQVLKALEKVEEERDEANAVIKQWEERQSKLQSEYDRFAARLEATQQAAEKSRAEIQAKDEHIRVLSEQNKHLLGLLETEEGKSREIADEKEGVDREHDRLTKIAEEYTTVKKTTEQHIALANGEVTKLQMELQNGHEENAELRAAAANYEAQIKVDLQSLEAALANAKAKNVQYLQQMQHNDVAEHRMQSDLQHVRDKIEQTHREKARLQAHLDGEEEDRDQFEKSRSTLHKKVDTLEAQQDQLRKALSAAEVQHEQLQDESRNSGEKFREMADKVYSLMDQLRLGQQELKNQELESQNRSKRVNQMEKQSASMQARLSLEVDSRQVAEGDARASLQVANLLEKKNRKLEDSLKLAQKAQDHAEARLKELQDRAVALQSQNAYLASRVDGQEEDKAALKQEVKRTNEQIREATLNGQQLNKTLVGMEDELGALEATAAAMTAEMDYIKREDMLDETGRTKPILIQSNESNLVERLQINEFIYTAQQGKNPVPMLVEKVSHLLELLHTAQTQADQYLNDLSRSNGLVQALRKKNLSLFEKAQVYEGFKMRALMKFVSNSFDSGFSNLHLDGLNFTNKSMTELLRLLTSFSCVDQISTVRLSGNALTDECVDTMLRIINGIPYIKMLDLSRNHFTRTGIQTFEDAVRQIEGITNVVRGGEGEKILAHSGNQLRLTILFKDQEDPKLAEDQAGFNAQDLSVKAADDFLNSAAGVVTGPVDPIMAGQAPTMQAESILPPIGKSAHHENTDNIPTHRGRR